MTDAVDALVETFRDVVAEQFRQNHEFGYVEDEAIDDFAKDAADVAISDIRWHLALGDCLRLGSVAKVTGVSRSELEERIAGGQLVALEGRYDVFLPTWQFAAPGNASHLEDNVELVLKVFREVLGSRYRSECVISWACTPQPEIEDKEPRLVMSDPKMAEGLVRAAEQAAWSLMR
ncbi:hypothetical protein ABZT48_07415 [Streptomyces avermitilis]|uniref:hypothetical protein n=1 Tax=Streptomyces avermitilis TaxID=33903 RepID=UPI0033A3C599